MKKSWLILFLLLLTAFGSSSCRGDAAVSGMPTLAVPEAGLGGVRGQVSNAETVWPDVPLMVYLADYYGEPQGDGFYLLEPNLSPKTELLTGGWFQANNLPPGNYVLVVGPEPRAGHLVVDQNRPLVVQVSADQVVQLGLLTVAP